jgi:signal transduction histidine kinase
VFLNLFLNALDAMREDGGVLRVRTRNLIKPGGTSWVQIETQDTGHGIQEANLEHIFDPFFTTKHESGEHEGTGLGLTIVHQIIEEHHGEIQVTSTLGSGTTFLVNLPAIPS